jgi:hypothetical protein
VFHGSSSWKEAPQLVARIDFESRSTGAWFRCAEEHARSNWKAFAQVFGLA